MTGDFKYIKVSDMHNKMTMRIKHFLVTFKMGNFLKSDP